MKLLFLFLCFALTTLSDARPNSLKQEKATCGYESCHPTTPGVMNVHLVPHTHDDVGWLKTIDQYYYGSRTNIQRAGVQYILDSVVDELLKDPVRRFVYVESAFFEKWWVEQTEERRDSVKLLVSEGRLEFAGGAWSMNDEACVNYQSVIDQITWGHRFLNDTFGECARPRIAWQIDPFGHSRELSSLWAQAGMDGLFFARIDYQDRKKRREDKSMEMIWRGSDDLGSSSDMLTGVLYSHYSPPPGFCFDVHCSDDPVIDDPESPDYNVDTMIERFLDHVNTVANAYNTNNIMLTMGDDFTYQDARTWYKNMDKLIRYVNAAQNSTKLIYSTPSCYLKSLYDSNATWPTKQDDFFPYASDPHAIWTGYFSSRATLKYFERDGNNLLQTCKQLQALTDPSDEKGLRSLRAAMGVMQHHDAITGTEKQHVAQDYARILEHAVQDCLEVSKTALNSLTSSDSNLEMTYCHLNMSECSVSEKNNAIILTVYNPTAFEVDEYIRFPFTGSIYYLILDHEGNMVHNRYMFISENLLEQLVTRKSNATFEILFKAEAIPPLGYKSYYIRKNASGLNEDLAPSIPNTIDEIYKKLVKNGERLEFELLENEFMKVSFDARTNLMSSITLIGENENTTIPVSQEILYYEGWSGNNSASENRASGAYIFRPTSEDPTVILDEIKLTDYNRNEMVQEIHQRFSEWVSQVIRLYKGQDYVEIEWLVGPIPIEDNIGKEVISRITTNFTTDGTYYTDSNGRQLLKRIRNKRPTWDLELQEPVSGNYYPITSMITMKDENTKMELAVLTDRAQAGGSMNDGQVELLIHRRLLHDDAFGAGEALVETVDGIGSIARGYQYIVLGKSDSPSPVIARSRKLALQKLMRPKVFFSTTNGMTFDDWVTNNNIFKGVNDLPENVHLLTLEPWTEGSLLLRLEHYFQKTDDPDGLSLPATVNLENIFRGITITSVREMTLAASQFKDEAKRLRWNYVDDMDSNFNEIYNANCSFDKKASNTCSAKSKHLFTHKLPNRFTNNDRKNKDIMVTLQPMEIKTFIVEISK